MGAKPSADQKTSSQNNQTTTEGLANLNSGQDLDQQVAQTPTLISVRQSNQQAHHREQEKEETKTNAVTTCISSPESHQQLCYGAACNSSGTAYHFAEAFGVSAADDHERVSSETCNSSGTSYLFAEAFGGSAADNHERVSSETCNSSGTSYLFAEAFGVSAADTHERVSSETSYLFAEAFGVSAADNHERVQTETSISHRLRVLSIQSRADSGSCSAAASPTKSSQQPFQDAHPEKSKTEKRIITSELVNAAGAHASVKIGSPACKQPSPPRHCAALVDKPAILQAPASVPLATHVLKWTIQDITNDNLLLHKVKPIPEAFTNLQEYLDCFKWPLLEEVRAQLKQALADHRIEVTPYACVHQTRKKKHTGSKISRDDSEPRIDVLLDRELERQTSGTNKDSGKLQLFALDLVLLSTVLPHSVHDLHQRGALHTFAFVINVKETPISNTRMWTTMVVQTSRESTQYQELLNGKRTWYALFVENLTPSLRIWEALHPSKSLAKSGFPIIRETLYSSVNPPGGTNISSKPATTRNHVLVSEAARDYCVKFHKLNNSQTNAIVDIVSDIESKRPPFVRMIQGPPGTGKTSTIVMLLALTSCLNLKCLVTAPTNAAISELATRFMNFLSKNSDQMIEHLDPFRKSFTRELASVKVRDVVLLGNEEKLRLQGELEEIFLPERIKRLMMAQRGWKVSARSILKILISGKSQYDRRLDLDLHSPTSHENYVSFLDYVKTTLSKLVTEAELHGKCLIRELPTSIIGKAGRKRLSEIVDLAVTLRDLVMSLDASQPAAITRDTLFATTTPLRCHLTEAAEAKIHERSSLEAACMKDSRIVFCTVCTAGRECVRRHAAPFDLLVIDEASQLVEAETAIVSQMPGLTNAVLVGDHKQLGATVISQGAARCSYGRSLFERLQKLDHPSHLLSIQYRMHPAISSFPNSQFYNSCIADGENVKSAKHNKKIYQNKLYGPFAVIDVGQGLEEDDSDTNKSKKNPVEAAVISFMIRKLSKVIAANNVANVSVGVITSYASQVSLLKTQLERVKMNPRLIVEVASVDAFQGQEKDIILLSTVRANKDGNIGFLKDQRRMNVALTRARYSLVLQYTASTPLNILSRLCIFSQRLRRGLPAVILQISHD